MMATKGLWRARYFSSSAEKEGNLAVQDGWVASFGKTKGKYGHRSPIERTPYIAVRNSGSMDGKLFREHVETVIFDLYPPETVSLEIKVDDHGRLKSARCCLPAILGRAGWRALMTKVGMIGRWR